MISFMKYLADLILDKKLYEIFLEAERRFEQAQSIENRFERIQVIFEIGNYVGTETRIQRKSGMYNINKFDREYEKGMNYLFRKFGYKKGIMEKRPKIFLDLERENKNSLKN